MSTRFLAQNKAPMPLIHLSQYEETIRFIKSSLEEREGEETFRLKLLKNKTARPTSERQPEQAA